MVSENQFVVEVTPLDINYDFKVNSDISMIKSKPKLLSVKLVGKDVNGRPDREIKGEFKYESLEAPVQQIMNASLAYPGNEVSYYSEIKQIKDLTYSGKVIYSPSKGRVVTIEHKESITNPTQKNIREIRGQDLLLVEIRHQCHHTGGRLAGTGDFPIQTGSAGQRQEDEPHRRHLREGYRRSHR
jgi:hypothetical protein